MGTDTLQDFDGDFLGYSVKEGGSNKIRDLIITSIEVSKRSKVPILFLSNPGYGKTTIINFYAELYGYHTEILIGSRYNPEDIMGYPVNDGGESLVTRTPEWFSRITKYSQGLMPDCEGAVIENDVVVKAGKPKPTILFLDEISTAHELVQGALLSLVFDRKIGNGKKLPEDCLIISAANYKENLSPLMNLLSPTLNRFCIINILPSSITPIDIVLEFTQQPGDEKKNPPVFKPIGEVNVQQGVLYDKMRTLYTNIVTNYMIADISKGGINLYNKALADIYESEADVYNFISGRTIAYSIRVMEAIISMGIPPDSYIVQEIIKGLIGVGSNSFDGVEQLEGYQRMITEEIYKIISDFYSHNSNSVVSETLDYEGLSITDSIKLWENYLESNQFQIDKNLINLFNKLVRHEKDISNNLQSYKDRLKNDDLSLGEFYTEKTKVEFFVSTMEILAKNSQNQNNSTINRILKQLRLINGFYSMVANSL